jgi:uncharacterized protein YbjT (DUF2867 family)
MNNKVLVVGATGYLGGKVVKGLLAHGKTVRALVRPSTDASALENLGVEIVRGDMMHKTSLISALQNVDTLITTANGYSQRKKGDTIATDDLGNRNLVDAAMTTKLPLFIFTGILTAEKARSVPHFYQKALTEEYIEKSHVPFISLRPGGFLDTLLGFSLKDIRNGKFRAMADVRAMASTILSDDVAHFLVESVDNPAAIGKRIDIGMDKPTNLIEIIEMLSKTIHKPIQLQETPPFVRKAMFGMMSIFNSFMRDNSAAMDYVSSGQYVADISQQRKLFGYVPTLADSLKRWAKENKFIH